MRQIYSSRCIAKVRMQRQTYSCTCAWLAQDNRLPLAACGENIPCLRANDTLLSCGAAQAPVFGAVCGASTAAALLSEFAQGFPWAHLDIAGTASSDAHRHYLRKGGVGFGVRLLTQLARTW